VDGLNRFRNHHSGYQVDLHFEGLNINLIYIKKQVLTPAIDLMVRVQAGLHGPILLMFFVAMICLLSKELVWG
jgi:hypothetical protein